jgi:NIMA (never in mitosis gene a)-related kinase
MNVVMQALNFPEEITTKYEIIQEMGRGAFSTVYKIKSKLDNNIYCLKKINIKKTPDKTNEINILSKINHPNLVQYISSCSDDEGIYIIMEFCIYGDLYSLLHMVKKKKVYVNEEIIWDIAYQCLLGLEYLHSQHIIHRDIKLLNIFMSKNKSVKIGDMGMSKILSNKEMKMSRVGTPLYLAPELVRKEKYDYKADIWSLGCSLYHLARTVPPFNDENLIRLGQAIVNDNPASLPSCYSDKLNFFINKLMTKDKKIRPSASEAILLIPDKTKNKFDISNYPNPKRLNISFNEKSKKSKISKSNSKDNNNINIKMSLNENILNINKDNNFKGKNELVSGQTFYKFFRKNSDKSERKKTLINLMGPKIGSTTSSQNLLFDSKNMNSYLIMSKTMGGTKEGFFKHKNILYSAGPVTKEKATKENFEINKYPSSPQEEQKTLEQNHDVINKNNKEINNLQNNVKPLIIKSENKNKTENNKNYINKEKIQINAEIKNDIHNNNIFIINNNEEQIKNNIKKNKTKNNIIFNGMLNFNNNSNKNLTANINNIFNKKSVNKNRSNIDFFNHFGILKSYQKDIPINKNILGKEDSKKKEYVSFPIIESNKNEKSNSQRFNKNNLFNYNKMDIFRRTANGFSFQNKLTIHDLK